MATPKSNATKITCNIMELFEAAATILSGTMSTNTCKGPCSFSVSAACCLAASDAEYDSASVFSAPCAKYSPGRMIFTNTKPKETASIVVIRYRAMVFRPRRDKREMFFKSETPFISENKMRGMATSFSRLIKMIPQGLIKSAVKLISDNFAEKRPYSTPSTNPAKIQIKYGIFRLLLFILARDSDAHHAINRSLLSPD